MLAARHTFDPTYGRRLTSDLADAGLERIESEGRAFVWRGGEPGGRAWQLTLSQLRDEMPATGLTAADVDGAIVCAVTPASPSSQGDATAPGVAARRGVARTGSPPRLRCGPEPR